MSTKWKTPIRCPDCGSTAVRRREIVHKSGTTKYSGQNSSSGFSFGLTGKVRPRIWFGGGSHSGKRQSIRAQESAPLPYWPPILLILLILIYHGKVPSFGLFAWIGIAFSGLWLLAAIHDRSQYRKWWLCNKCGASFIPEPKESVKEEIPPPPLMEKNDMSDTQRENIEGGKACSICGQWYPLSEYEYGNRENRSYCQKCNSEEKAAYSQGGVEAARQYREKMRETWKKV